MINPEPLINKFLILLRCYWMEIEELSSRDTTGSFKEDWLQANWELIVESFLSKEEKIYLGVYGDGADANGESCRILFPNALPSHVICCNAKDSVSIYDHLNKKQVLIPMNAWPISKFVSLEENGWYYERLPFDKVLVEILSQEYVFDIKNVKFSLVEIKKLKANSLKEPPPKFLELFNKHLSFPIDQSREL